MDRIGKLQSSIWGCFCFFSHLVRCSLNTTFQVSGNVFKNYPIPGSCQEESYWRTSSSYIGSYRSFKGTALFEKQLDFLDPFAKKIEKFFSGRVLRPIDWSGSTFFFYATFGWLTELGSSTMEIVYDTTSWKQTKIVFFSRYFSLKNFSDKFQKTMKIQSVIHDITLLCLCKIKAIWNPKF